MEIQQLEKIILDLKLRVEALESKVALLEKDKNTLQHFSLDTPDLISDKD
ncbi:TPA: hypothetical protein R1712_000920 [Campylobacter lari]|nr:hypothetical protein [Campylobacter lari]